MPILRLLILVVLLCPALAAAAALRLCTDVHPHPPYQLPDGSGTVDRLVASAAASAGLQLQFRAVPLTRCQAETRLNVLDGYPMAPYMPDLLDFVVYPMRSGAVDPARASGRARVLLFARSGSPASWNGSRFSGLKRAVMVPTGSAGMSRAVAAHTVPLDETGKSLQINFARLLAGRGDLAAGFEEDGKRLMLLPEFAGKVAPLPVPLFEQTYYLVVTKAYYARHGAAVEAMWDQLGRLNQAAKAQKK